MWKNPILEERKKNVKKPYFSGEKKKCEKTLFFRREKKMSKNPIFQERKKNVKKPYFSGEKKKCQKFLQPNSLKNFLRRWKKLKILVTF